MQDLFKNLQKTKFPQVSIIKNNSGNILVWLMAIITSMSFLLTSIVHTSQDTQNNLTVTSSQKAFDALALELNSYLDDNDICDSVFTSGQTQQDLQLAAIAAGTLNPIPEIKLYDPFTPNKVLVEKGLSFRGLTIESVKITQATDLGVDINNNPKFFATLEIQAKGAKTLSLKPRIFDLYTTTQANGASESCYVLGLGYQLPPDAYTSDQAGQSCEATPVFLPANTLLNGTWGKYEARTVAGGGFEGRMQARRSRTVDGITESSRSWQGWTNWETLPFNFDLDTGFGSIIKCQLEANKYGAKVDCDYDAFQGDLGPCRASGLKDDSAWY